MLDTTSEAKGIQTFKTGKGFYLSMDVAMRVYASEPKI